MPSTAGSARRSSASNSRVMLTVERTSVEGSMHDAWLPDDTAARSRAENKHRRIAPSPECAVVDDRGAPQGAPRHVKLIGAGRLPLWPKCRGVEISAARQACCRLGQAKR